MLESVNFSAPSYIHSLAWSPNGETLAVGTRDSITFFSTSGQIQKTYSTLPNKLRPTSEKRDAGPETPNAGIVSALWWAPDGKSLVARVYGVGLPLWNTQNDQLRFFLDDHPEGTTALAWSPSCDSIASGGDDTLIWLFDTKTGKRTETLDLHLFPVHQLAFGKTDDELVSLGIRPQFGPQNTEIKHWSIAKGLPTTEIMQDYGVSASVLSPQGDTCSLLFKQGEDDSLRIAVWLCDTTTGKKIRTPLMLPWIKGMVHLFSPSGNTFTTYSYVKVPVEKRPGTVPFRESARTYFTRNAKPLMEISRSVLTPISPNSLPPRAAAISTQGILAVSSGKSIQLWTPPF